VPCIIPVASGAYSTAWLVVAISHVVICSPTSSAYFPDGVDCFAIARCMTNYVASITP
jgi:hypothetical protein